MNTQPIAVVHRRRDKPLSRLIREGAAHVPFCAGQFLRMNGDERRITGACAIGLAAVAAAGSLDYDTVRPQLYGLNQALAKRTVEHPVYGLRCSLFAALVDVVDECRWTPTKVAQWLEGMGL